MHLIELKKVGNKTLPVLCHKTLCEGEYIKVKFSDEHTEAGKVIMDFDRHGSETPFLAVEYHGKKPWVNLVGMLASRVAP